MLKVGDFVYVPDAYTGMWKPGLTRIDDITEDGNYLCTLLVSNCAARCDEHRQIEFRKEQVFPYPEKEKCQEYILLYYYGGYCRGCKYEHTSGAIWKCGDCSHKRRETNESNSYFDKFVCDRTGITIGGSYAQFHEICKHYDPTLPQNKRDYQSWEVHDDILRNCDFNPNCETHAKSALKTCPYERYMNEFVSFPVSGIYDGKIVNYGVVRRKDWIENNFVLGDRTYEVIALKFAPEYTANKRIKKGTANRMKVFDIPIVVTLKEIPADE